jgi:two-component system, chemotaxis family, sensor kinase Cph1
MKNYKNPKDTEDLRGRAEESLRSGSCRPADECMEEVETLIHELRVHQVELEMQNEELRRVQNDLEVSRSRYADLYDFAPVGYLTLDKQGRIVDLNLTAARQIGIERGHLINQHLQNFVPQPDKKVLLSHLNVIFDKRERQIADVRLSSKDREQFHARLESIYLEGEDGAGLCRTSMSDVTLRKEAEQVLQNAHDQLERRVVERTAELTKEIAVREKTERELKVSNRELQDFAFIASHDMQEPLRKIQTFANLIQEGHTGAMDSTGRDFFERIINAAKRMSDMIQGLLDFSRVESRSNPFTTVDLNQLMRNVLSDIEVLIQKSGAGIEVADLPAIEADPIQMRQLFQNIIINSLKFRGEKNPVVRIYAKPEDACRPGNDHPEVKAHRICIEDNGIGFDEKYLNRIFTLFQRLNGKSAYEGTGMGLAVCRRIVERHKGHITARSSPGHGATFMITLPEKQFKPVIDGADPICR